MKDNDYQDFYLSRYGQRGVYIDGQAFCAAVDKYIANPSEEAMEILVRDYLDTLAAKVILAFLKHKQFYASYVDAHTSVVSGMVMALVRGKYNKKRRGRNGDSTTPFKYLTSVGRNELMQYLRKEAKHHKTNAILLDHIAASGTRDLAGCVEQSVEVQLITGNRGGF